MQKKSCVLFYAVLECASSVIVRFRLTFRLIESDQKQKLVAA